MEWSQSIKTSPEQKKTCIQSVILTPTPHPNPHNWKSQDNYSEFGLWQSWRIQLWPSPCNCWTLRGGVRKRANGGRKEKGMLWPALSGLITLLSSLGQMVTSREKQSSPPQSPLISLSFVGAIESQVRHQPCLQLWAHCFKPSWRWYRHTSMSILIKRLPSSPSLACLAGYI